MDNSLHTVSTSSTLSGQKHKISEVNVDERGGNVEDNLHTFDILPSNTLEVNVDNVDTKTPPSQNSEALMQSCTTPKAAKPELKVGDNVVVARSDVSMYRGQRGRITEAWWTRDGKR